MADDALRDRELYAGADAPALSASSAESISRRPQDMVPAELLRLASQRTDRHGLIYFLGHYALIAIGAVVCWFTLFTLWFWPTLLVYAVVIGFLFSPLHECAHGTAFKTRWLNEAALWITALVYIVPPYYFRFFHLGHHRYTQVPGKDPSLVLPEPANVWQYLWYCAGLWFWWRNLSWMLQHAFGKVHPSSADYVPRARGSLMVTEARVMLSFYVAVLVVGALLQALDVLIVCWLLPRLLGEPFQRVMRVAEHVGCDESTNLLNNTRTTRSNALVNWIAWQMPFHAEHHLFPNVPFHALPRLHQATASQVVVETGGYLVGQLKIVRWLLRDRSDPATLARRP